MFECFFWNCLRSQMWCLRRIPERSEESTGFTWAAGWNPEPESAAGEEHRHQQVFAWKIRGTAFQREERGSGASVSCQYQLCVEGRLSALCRTGWYWALCAFGCCTTCASHSLNQCQLSSIPLLLEQGVKCTLHCPTAAGASFACRQSRVSGLGGCLQ